MKRFYPEASVAVIGAVDPDYRAISSSCLDAQDNFIDRAADRRRSARLRVLSARLAAAPRPDAADGRSTTRCSSRKKKCRASARALKRKFQYARSSDGRSWLWIGRSKIAGRGEAASSLRFDVAVKTTTLR